MVILTACDSPQSADAQNATQATIKDAAARTPPHDADIIVVGAGIAGLSSALEAARGGASVLLVDKWSLFGGHAVMSMGALNIVGTPTQEEQGVHDTPEQAEEDFLTWGVDANPGWVKYYSQNSKTELFDWLTEMGVRFSRVAPSPGNSVPRIHILVGRGLGLVSPIYRNALLNPNIRFAWNVNVERLLKSRDRVIGVEGRNSRTGESQRFFGQFVMLATGGFQSNLTLVKENWRPDLKVPDTILAGSGINSQGSGLAMAREMGAALLHLDHQWNYVTGLPDPRHPDEPRGLSAWNFNSIWVNADGKRFVNERASPAVAFPALLAQEPASYWQIFDQPGKQGFAVSGSDWADRAVVERIILSNADLVKSAMTLEALAQEIGIPLGALTETVSNYNQQLVLGEDTDFGQFGPRDTVPPPIATPPFYAVKFFPLTRKSMGGVAIDLQARVVDEAGKPIAGLLAAGEVTGFGGINGSAALEGTFLGPSIVIGRVAARTMLAELEESRELVTTHEREYVKAAHALPVHSAEACLDCHDLASQVSQTRAGYLHFEAAHAVVLDSQADCLECHAEMSPVDLSNHATDRLLQVDTCQSCHVSREFKID